MWWMSHAGWMDQGNIQWILDKIRYIISFHQNQGLFQYEAHNFRYRQVSYIRRTLVGNKIVDHSGFNGLGKDNWKMRRETFKFGDLVCLILEILRYMHSNHIETMVTRPSYLCNGDSYIDKMASLFSNGPWFLSLFSISGLTKLLHLHCRTSLSTTNEQIMSLVISYVKYFMQCQQLSQRMTDHWKMFCWQNYNFVIMCIIIQDHWGNIQQSYFCVYANNDPNSMNMWLVREVINCLYIYFNRDKNEVHLSPVK